jgi:hypothetical protein
MSPETAWGTPINVGVLATRIYGATQIMRHMIIPGILVFASLSAVPLRVTQKPVTRIESSTDVQMLRRIATEDGTEDTENGMMGQSGKAYVRLGALGTVESRLADSAEILCAQPNRHYVRHGTLMLH